MTKLGPEARALVEAGRHGLKPTAADRERVLEALRVRIEQGAPPSPDGGGAPAAGHGLGWPLSAGLMSGAALVGGVLWALFTPPEPLSAVLSPALSTSALVRAAEAPVAPLPVEAAPAPSSSPPSTSAEPVRSPGPRPPATNNTLAEEVALLSRAETELHAGRFASALRLLDEYERRFPRGALMQENVSARVQALCALGRVAAAEQQLKRLSPGSPHAGRARAACGKR